MVGEGFCLVIVAFVVVAGDARVKDKSHKVGLNQHLNISLTTSNYADACGREFIQRTLSHIARQHNIYSHIVEC